MSVDGCRPFSLPSAIRYPTSLSKVRYLTNTSTKGIVQYNTIPNLGIPSCPQAILPTLPWIDPTQLRWTVQSFSWRRGKAGVTCVLFCQLVDIPASPRLIEVGGLRIGTASAVKLRLGIAPLIGIPRG